MEDTSININRHSNADLEFVFKSDSISIELPNKGLASLSWFVWPTVLEDAGLAERGL